MVMLYGETFTRAQLRERVGHESQIGGVRRMTLDDGNQKGTEMVEFRTGTGLLFQALPTRGLDIGIAEYQGRPVAWRSRTGEVEPGYLGDVAVEARRGSFGGLMCTCGYSNVGVPNEDEGMLYGLHGRAQLQPACGVQDKAEWRGDDYVMWCEGTIRELDKFQEYFANSRRIETRLGSNTITVRDKVTNLSFARQPHMILYHCNFGWPLISGETRIYAPSKSRRNRDKDTIDFDWTRYPAAPRNQPEDVLYHEMQPDADGMVRLSMINETPGKERWGLSMTYTYETLPRLVHWFQPSQGAYVMGMEPGNCWADGRNAHRKRNDLVMLEPDESREYMVEFTVLPGEKEVAKALSSIHAMK